MKVPIIVLIAVVVLVLLGLAMAARIVKQYKQGTTIAELGSFLAREEAAATPTVSPGAVMRAPTIAANGATNAS